MNGGSKQWRRNAEKESFWRSHLSRQPSSGESIRGYCRRRSLSEASFHFWRREIASRDRQASSTSLSATAGLVAVQVVGEPTPIATVTQTMDIECSGGPVIRLREEVSAEVLLRVIRACQQVQIEGAPGGGLVRSC